MSHFRILSILLKYINIKTKKKQRSKNKLIIKLNEFHSDNYILSIRIVTYFLIKVFRKYNHPQSSLLYLSKFQAQFEIFNCGIYLCVQCSLVQYSSTPDLNKKIKISS